MLKDFRTIVKGLLKVRFTIVEQLLKIVKRLLDNC